MQERRLRLGDVLDDYCPREKRLSNHAIVALVDDEVRTTRCSTCDFEHVYKGGKVPTRRKKADRQAVLYKTVLENITGRDAETGVPLPAAIDPDVPQAPVAAAVAAAPRLTPAAPPRRPSRRARWRSSPRLRRRRTTSRSREEHRASPYPDPGHIAQDRGTGPRAQAGGLHVVRATDTGPPLRRRRWWRASAPAASGTVTRPGADTPRMPTVTRPARDRNRARVDSLGKSRPSNRRGR